ncbi:Putative auto-transporter adhesin, head GIN domain [Flavobacteriaceae bacterium MAR_2010_188]|nr:Putative auto-transporter adhesin, head GIN domain [Flavobacteriaceae bacterium MAR_2010_188]
MQKSLIILLFIVVLPMLVKAQDDDKIKGNRDVTIEQTYIDAFNKIIVGEEFSVEIIYNAKPSIQVETDSNLHEYIEFAVVDSVLTFKSTSRITSSRKMNITVNYSNKLKEIETKDDAEIRSLTSLELGNTLLKTSGTSKAYLNIKANKFNFQALDKSRIRLNVTANESVFDATDNVKLEALVNSPKFTVNLHQRATADIEGTATDVILKTDNNSKFDGKNFTTKTCNLISEVDSEVYIEVTSAINISASGTSQIYLYNNPTITMERFIDGVKLQKKTK